MQLAAQPSNIIPGNDQCTGLKPLIVNTGVCCDICYIGIQLCCISSDTCSLDEHVFQMPTLSVETWSAHNMVHTTETVV